ncbi:MAG: hypothetical protein KJ645_03455, partial [Planctomycetes bacterium]|nr:hypothetical protein [Planctomycetota bacterium]
MRCAEALGNQDGRVFALYRLLNLAITQDAPQEEIDALQAEVFKTDPLAEAQQSFKNLFVEKFQPLAVFHEEHGRAHSAIRIYNAILALVPERKDCAEKVFQIASAPDPSLADSAQDKDLLAGKSKRWIEWFDRNHNKWGDKARLERENYTTNTDAGYEALVRTAETMECVNAFFRNFFNYGSAKNDKPVPRIDLNILKDEEEFRKVTGMETAAGYFSGGSIFAYVGQEGLEEMIRGTLIHEVAHQFVHLATKASDTLWLNEGIATYFEGCQILANGAVLM